MTQDARLLDAISHAAETGRNTLLAVRPLTGNAALRSSIDIQMKEYGAVMSAAHAALRHTGGTVPAQSNLTRLGTFFLMRTKTLGDKSTRTLAELLLQGLHDGVVDLTETTRDCPDAGAAAQTLAQRLLIGEQRSYEEWKSYL